jgi:PilZ domain-containing protein
LTLQQGLALFLRERKRKLPQDTRERREYVRATLATQVKIKSIEESEFDRIKGANIEEALPLKLTTEDSENGASLSGPLLQWLIHIDEKLNRILQKLEPDTEDAEAVCVGNARNISGVGLNLALDSPMPIGQKILISFPLPGLSASPFQAYGEVVRVRQKDENGEKVFEIGVKFIIINEVEREKLIAYSFCEQRKVIRNASKENNDIGEDV